MKTIVYNLLLKSELLLVFVFFIQMLNANYWYDADLKKTEYLIVEYIEKDIKKADSLCQILIKDAVKNKYSLCLGYFYKGEIAYYQAEWNDAIEYYQKSILCLKSYNDTSRLAITYNNLGISLLYQSLYNKAIEAFLQSLEYEKISNNPEGIAQSYQNISLVYENQGKMEKAIEFNLKAIEILLETEEEKDLAGAYNNHAVLYTNEDNFKEAEKYYSKAMDIYKKLNYKDLEAKVLFNIGCLLVKQGKYDEGGKILEKALILFNSNNDITSEIHAYGMLADMYARKNDYHQAVFLSETAWEKVKNCDEYSSQLRCLYSLYVYNKKLEKWKEALDFLETYKNLKDRLLELDSSTTDDIFNIEMEHKMSEIEILKKQKNKVEKNFGIAVIVFFVIIFFSVITIRIYIRQLKGKRWKKSVY